MNSDTIKLRTKNIKLSLKQKNIDSLILTRESNITYLTGFTGQDSWAIITPRTAYLITDSRYTQLAQKQCPYTKIIIRNQSLPIAAANILKRLKTANKIAVENNIELAAYQAIKKAAKINLKSSANIVESLRTIKDTHEINSIKKAAQIAAEALEKTLACIQPSITEFGLAALLDYNIRQLNARNSFDTIVAFGPNAACPHHQPTNRKLKTNDTILIDFGAKYNGYCSDITRCFTVGKPSSRFKKVYGTVLKAQKAAISAVKQGISVKTVDSAAREVIENSGLPLYSHGTGHGIGLDIHEVPLLSSRSNQILQPGMVITIEPAVYIPQKLGIRIEDDILVTEKGPKVLTPELHKYDYAL
ncbi:MAG: aminopeptidase P family protein [Planctomycetes bacterium]|nr:aminopeptidase P family protein [Planctomycetota bacterium]MBL7107174.1 aminopeptidase P family protein [Phycisphaerae bacterium]